jgi:hypothetical protein
MQDAPYRLVPVSSRDGVVHALVDPGDHERLLAHAWHLDTGGYPIRSLSHHGRKAKRSSQSMHRQVMGLGVGDGCEVDHINRDKLDNRRSNLRLVTHSQNMQNLGPHPGKGFRGVTWFKVQQRWRARAQVDGVVHFLGYHDSEKAAARAVNEFWIQRGQSAPNDLAA